MNPSPNYTGPHPSILLCTSSQSGQQILYIYPPPVLHNTTSSQQNGPAARGGQETGGSAATGAPAADKSSNSAAIGRKVPSRTGETPSSAAAPNSNQPKNHQSAASPKSCPLSHFYHFKLSSLAPLLTNSNISNTASVSSLNASSMSSHHQRGATSSSAAAAAGMMNRASSSSASRCNILSIPPYFFLSRVIHLENATEVQKCSLVLMIPTGYLRGRGMEDSSSSGAAVRGNPQRRASYHSRVAADGSSATILPSAHDSPHSSNNMHHHASGANSSSSHPHAHRHTSIIALYQNLLNMIGNAYEREQKRCQFLEKWLVKLLRLREELSSAYTEMPHSPHSHDSSSPHPVPPSQGHQRRVGNVSAPRHHGSNSRLQPPNNMQRMNSHQPTWELLHHKVRSWTFIQNLMKLGMSIIQGGSLSLRINGWIEVGCRLPSLRHATASHLDSSAPLLQLHDACVKVKEENLPHRLKFPPDGLHDIQSVLQWVSPLKSLRDIAREQNLASSLVLNIAQHLVGWGIIRPISKLTKNTILVISEHASFPPPKSDLEKFEKDIHRLYSGRETRLPTLIDLLAYFSNQRVFQDVLTDLGEGHYASGGSLSGGISAMSSSQDTAVVKTIVWLLENCYIRPVRQYIQFCIPPDVSSYLQQSSPNVSSASGASTSYMSRRSRALNDYEIEFLREKCNDKRLLNLVKQLHGYFNGEYTIEEILTIENVSREELNRVLHTYKDVIISYDE